MTIPLKDPKMTALKPDIPKWFLYIVAIGFVAVGGYLLSDIYVTVKRTDQRVTALEARFDMLLSLGHKP